MRRNVHKRENINFTSTDEWKEHVHKMFDKDTVRFKEQTLEQQCETVYNTGHVGDNNSAQVMETALRGMENNKDLRASSSRVNLNTNLFE